MSLFVEVMCDALKEWPEGGEQLGMRCATHRGDNPQGDSVSEARKAARKQGWLVEGNYAECPDCRETTFISPRSGS